MPRPHRITALSTAAVVTAIAIAVSSARPASAQVAGPAIKRHEIAPSLDRQEPNTWVKRSPIPGAPISPCSGYEGSIGYFPQLGIVISYAGHNQSGGEEQNAETWILNPKTMQWELRHPNDRPPGSCCNMQNVVDPVANRFLRFRAFSGSHGWQWFRQIYLTNTSVWSYDPVYNKWRNPRPVPEMPIRPQRCATWDSHEQVAVVFGGEGSNEGTLVYDPYVNRWTKMNPDPQPRPRSGGNMAYDQAHRLHILFGAQNINDPHTWAYDLRKNAWRDLKPANQPNTDRNVASLAYDSANRVIIGLIRDAEGEGRSDAESSGHTDTWILDVAKNEWRKMNPDTEPPGRGNRFRKLVYLPDHNVALLENFHRSATSRTGRWEQQIWTYRYSAAPADPRPAPPLDVTVTTDAGSATLAWEIAPGKRPAQWEVHRGIGDESTPAWKIEYAKIAQLPGEATTWKDTTLKRGQVAFYFLRPVDAGGRAGEDSVKVRTQPRIVEDIVVSVLSPKQVRLTWAPPAGADDIVGYVVERAPVQVYSEDQIKRLKTDTPPPPDPAVGMIRAIGRFERLTEQPIAAEAFTDDGVDLSRPHESIEGGVYRNELRADSVDETGKPYRYAVYAYRVRAVNRLGVTGGDSPYSLTIPSAPQHVFSKEEGEKCHIRWNQNPEQNIVGYRVYRMDDPRINGAGQKTLRRTPEPLNVTNWTDEDAGDRTKRYWIVAVDGLGQEGIPSSPTWHKRKWGEFYTDFHGEWHQ